MKILVSSDSFKNSISSKQIGSIVQNKLNKHHMLNRPLADGGEGSLDLLFDVTNYQKVNFLTLDTYQKPTTSHYLYDSKTKTAFIETALICGVEMIESDLKIMDSSSIGVGKAIDHAANKGAEIIHLFMGGTATNDGGLGLLKGLGYKFYDNNNRLLQGKTEELGNVFRIEEPKIKLKIKCINLISDVDNPLLGHKGATYVYGKQKGGSHEQLKTIDYKMNQYSKVLSNYFNVDYTSYKSSGAAGGLGYALMHIFPFKVQSGIKYFIEQLEIESLISEVDLVITGEGRIDNQSFHGKVISEVINLCRKYNTPYILICGQLDYDKKKLTDKSLKKIIVLSEYANSLSESIDQASQFLEQAIGEIDVKSLL